VFVTTNGTFVVSSWYAEHEGTRGILLLNDYALGDLLGGEEGSRAEPVRQGFSAIRLLSTPHEVEKARELMRMAPGSWNGPWKTLYAWQESDIV